MVKLLRLLGQLHHFYGVPKGSGIRRFGARRNRLWVYGFLDLSWADGSQHFPGRLSFFWASAGSL